MSVQVISDFQNKIADKRLKKHFSSLNKTLKLCLLDLQNYINEIVDEYIGEEFYDENTISKWIYRDIDKNEQDVEKFAKVNLFAAKTTFTNIIKDISHQKGGLNYHNIRQYREILWDFLHDISGFIDYYKQKTDPSFRFLSGWKSYQTSSFETFKMAKLLFYSSTIQDIHIPYKESQGITIMVIRQSIELKTKRIFGIYKINKNRNRVPDYGFKRLFDFIELNQNDIIYNPIDFDILKNIYKWSCTFIHNGEGSYIWQTETAINYLEKYFEGGSLKVENKTISSVFGAFKIRNFRELRNKLESYVGNDYSIEFFPDSGVEAIIESE